MQSTGAFSLVELRTDPLDADPMSAFNWKNYNGATTTNSPLTDAGAATLGDNLFVRYGYASGVPVAPSVTAKLVGKVPLEIIRLLDGNSIAGVELSITRSASPGYNIHDVSLRMYKNGILVGVDKAQPSNNWSAGMATVIYGGPLDAWGTDMEMLQTDTMEFSLTIQSDGPFAITVADIDHISVNIYYDSIFMVF